MPGRVMGAKQHDQRLGLALQQVTRNNYNSIYIPAEGERHQLTTGNIAILHESSLQAQLLETLIKARVIRTVKTDKKYRRRQFS